MGQGLRRRYRRNWAVEQLDSRVLLADLSGAFFDAQVSAAPGRTIDVNYEISNGGPEDTASFHVGWYLSANPTISGTDTLLGGADLALLGNANTGHVAKSLTLPASSDPFWQSITGWTYYIGMIIDTNNTVLETNENNNANGGQGLDRDSLILPPDLFGSFFDAPASASPGGSVNVTYEITNGGAATTPAFQVEWYLSSDSIISGADIKLGGADTTVAGFSSTGHVSKSLTLPGPDDTFWQGRTTYYIGMLIDTNSTVDETNESNNSNRGQALDRDSLVMTPMELIGSFFDAPAAAAPGATVDVTYEISNSGAGATPAFHVDWYLSKNSTISTSDLLLGAGAELNLAGNANTGHIAKSLTLPGSGDPFWQGVINGTYYLGMIIDTNNTVAETAENNNANHGQGLDFDSTTIDGTSPTVTLFPVTPPTSGSTAAFSVTYADNLAIKFSTLGNGDIRVTGPNGYSELATLLSSSPAADSSSLTVIYTIPAPDGGWDSTDNGAYIVSMVASQVSDTGNTFVAAGALGTFSVNIAANPPTIASLSDSPDPVIRPGNLTLTANGVTGGAGTVNLVEFYRDSNNNGLLDIGTDALLGSDTDSTGGWSLAVSTLGSPLGTNRYFARAQTIDGFWSNLVSATGIVNNGNPTIDSLSATPDPVTRGTDITLTANNTIDADGSIAKVEFYRDSNENGTFELGTDTLLGSDTSSAGGWTFITSSLALKLAPGTNRFFARATDNDGAVSIAKTTTVVANNAK